MYLPTYLEDVSFDPYTISRDDLSAFDEDDVTRDQLGDWYHLERGR